jgi:SAM-dependent methyltransferase
MTDDSLSGIPGQADIVENIIASSHDIGRLLDIGFGGGHVSKKFSDAGIKVTATGFDIDRYGVGNRLVGTDIEVLEGVDICDMSQFADNTFDAIWCSHVLEHVMNTGRALEEVRRVLRDEGLFFVSVPPFKHEVVGGHIHPGWNVGILLYVLLANGFDASEGEFIRHGYNIAGVVKNRKKTEHLERLKYASGDLELLMEAGVVPPGIEFTQGVDGNRININWSWRIEPSLTPLENEHEHSVASPHICGPKEQDRAFRILGSCIPKEHYRQMSERQLVEKYLPSQGFFRLLELKNTASKVLSRVLQEHNDAIEQHQLLLIDAQDQSAPVTQRKLLEQYNVQSFDYVFSHQVFHYGTRSDLLLKQVHRLMRGGSLLLGKITLNDPDARLEVSQFTVVGWFRMLVEAGFEPVGFYAGVDTLSLQLARTDPSYKLREKPFTYSRWNKTIDNQLAMSEPKVRNLNKLLNCGTMFFCARKTAQS